MAGFMKVSDQIDGKLAYAAPLSFQLSPGFLRALRAELIQSQDAEPRPCVGHKGLLFGSAKPWFVSVEEFRPFPSQYSESGTSSPGELDAAVQKLLAGSEADSELAGLQLIGWYSIGAQNAPGLNARGFEFHNRYFQHAADIALVITPESSATVLLEVYARESEGVLSKENQRKGLWRLALPTEDQISAPVDLVVAAGDNDYHYARVYEVLSSLDESTARHWPERVIGSVLRPHARRGGTESLSGEHGVSVHADSSRLAAIDPPGRIDLPAGPIAHDAQLPAGMLSFAQAGPERRSGTLRYILSAGVLALIAGMALAWLFAHRQAAVPVIEASAPTMDASASVGMKVEGQGDGMLVSWDRQLSQVRTATGGLLTIDDGPQRRRVVLNEGDLASGSILYRPESSDVNLALELFTPEGGVLTDHMRVLDGTRVRDRLYAPELAMPARAQTASLKAPGLRGRRNSGIPARPLPGVVEASSDVSRTRSSERAETSAAPKQAVETQKRAPVSFDRPAAEPTQARSQPEAHARLQQTPVFRDESGGAAAGASGVRASINSGVPPVGTDAAPHQIAISKASTHTSSLPGASERLAPTLTKTPDPRLKLDYVQPRALKQVMPNTTLFGVSAVRGSKDVAVSVQIDRQGHVTGVRALDGPQKNRSLMTSAAISAAKKWVFEPAKLHGVSVASEHTIIFRFEGSVR